MSLFDFFVCDTFFFLNSFEVKCGKIIFKHATESGRVFEKRPVESKRWIDNRTDDMVESEEEIEVTH